MEVWGVKFHNPVYCYVLFNTHVNTDILELTEVNWSSPFSVKWCLLTSEGFIGSHTLTDVSVSLSLAGEKKFVCTECSKRFMRSDHLAKHIKTHQNKKGIPATSPPTTDTVITADGTTLILQTATTHDLVGNQEIPLQLVTVAPGEVMEWGGEWGKVFFFLWRTGLSKGPLGLFSFTLTFFFCLFFTYEYIRKYIWQIYIF